MEKGFNIDMSRRSFANGSIDLVARSVRDLTEICEYIACDSNVSAHPSMNKAFTRDPDPVESARCPRCQSIGLPVTRETLESFVLPEALDAVAESAFFCPYPTCE